jgi:hypothetical protein
MIKLIKNRAVIAVKNLKRSCEYYQSSLGFKINILGDTDWAFAERENFFLMIGECKDALNPKELLCHSYFAYVEVIDIDSLFLEFKQNNVIIKQVLKDRPWRMKEFEIETIDGHRIMFGEEIKK